MAVLLCEKEIENVFVWNCNDFGDCRIMLYPRGKVMEKIEPTLKFNVFRENGDLKIRVGYCFDEGNDIPYVISDNGGLWSKGLLFDTQEEAHNFINSVEVELLD